MTDEMLFRLIHYIVSKTAAPEKEEENGVDKEPAASGGEKEKPRDSLEGGRDSLEGGRDSLEGGRDSLECEKMATCSASEGGSAMSQV